jgi:N-formylglutamate amidohydrolase
MLPLLVSTPHSSGHVPYWILSRMLEGGEPEASLRRRLFREGDPYTDAIFCLGDAKVILDAPASRFVADTNRRRHEPGENGVIKLAAFDRQRFYPPGFALTPEDRERRLEMYYDPFHRALERHLGGGDIGFFIDGHSMTGTGPAVGPDQGAARPAVCIGNLGDAEGESAAPTSCSPVLARRIRDRCQDLLGPLIAETGLAGGVRLNQPFGGGHILRQYSRPPFGVPGVMIEVNRDLYLDEETLQPIPGRIERLRQAFSALAVSLFASGQDARGRAVPVRRSA